jgi:hypothetical protein
MERVGWREVDEKSWKKRDGFRELDGERWRYLKIDGWRE